MKKVREYTHPSSRDTDPIAISYVWCSNCGRYAGSTGPAPAGVEIRDPLTEEDHLRFLYDLRGLLDHLDHLWDTGVLPP
jgi:hypothetical protein